MVNIDKKVLGREIENMETTFKGQDQGRYLEIIEKYVGEMYGTLTITECIERLDNQKCLELHYELLALKYEEE